MASFGPVPHAHSASAPYLSQPAMGAWYPEQSFGCVQSYALVARAQNSPAYLPFPGQIDNYHQLRYHYPRVTLSNSWTDVRHVTPRPFNNSAVHPFPHSGRIVTQPHPPAAIPDAPRGPPRKPKQSGHAVWIGNLPVGTNIHDFKDYCTRGATNDIESIFLISKSNCAFANFNSPSACEAAISRIQSSSFHGRRLVCRSRMDSSSSSSSSFKASPASTTRTTSTASDVTNPTPRSNSDEMPLIVKSHSPKGPELPLEVKKDIKVQALVLPKEAIRAPERFFIIKSLTIQDLVASVNNGIWEAQTHNEDTLQDAFRTSENVYLIFSANKSGEYFGLARMTSDISIKPEEVSTDTPSIDKHSRAGEPRSIVTTATDSAPSGRIHDDSARGTIFWEADRVVSPSDTGLAEEESAERKQFSIEWLSTARVPFFRLRGLRNPWNGMKEVKIARDGTELEPSVGRAVAQSFRLS